MMQWTVGFTASAAVFDFLKALPAEALSALRLERITELAVEWIPLAGLGFGWVLPAFLGLLIGLLIKAGGRRAATRKTMGGIRMSAVQNDFSKGSVVKNIANLALPMTLAQLVNVLYNVVDRVYIGHMPQNATESLTGLGH